MRRVVVWVLIFTCVLAETPANDLPWIEVSREKSGFITNPGGKLFAPWGFNYDHDAEGRLIEDYWEAEWSAVERHFGEMKNFGANVVRVHLQLSRFMEGPDKPNGKSLARLSKLIALAERVRLYLDLTGLGCYHKKDVPEWYDSLSEQGRWRAQAAFWQAVAKKAANSSAVFCFDLMNEPVVPGGKRVERDWLGPPFGDKHFVQFITLDQAGRPRPDIARAWIQYLTSAIRTVDQRHLITVGMVDWSLDRPGLTSGFVPDRVSADLDFLCVHIYPERGKTREALATLKGFNVGKPVVVEETFPLKCSSNELLEFMNAAGQDAAGWISFYWGKPPDELRRSNAIGDAILRDWLEVFRKRAP